MRIQVASGVLAIAALFTAYMGYGFVEGSRQLVYHARDPEKAVPPVLGGRVQLSADHLDLAAWWLPAARPTHDAVLVLHGRGASKATSWKKLGFLHDRFNLFMLDFRACGESGGDQGTLGAYELHDAQAAMAWLDQHGANVGVVGESLGGAVAIALAAKDPRAKAVVSDCAFDTAEDAIKPRVANRGYPFAGAMTQAILFGVKFRTGAWLPDADPLTQVARIAPRPLFLIHGKQDDETPWEDSQRLFDAAGQPKRVWYTAARHGESWREPGYAGEVGKFLTAALTSKR